MIHESFYWKKELYKSFLTIAKFRHLKRVTEQSEVKVEKALMVGAYIIRKLDDAQKIPPAFLSKKEPLKIFYIKGTIVDHMNWHKIDTHYNLENISKIEKDWRFIVNQIIHSFTIIFSNHSTNKLEAFYLILTRQRKKGYFFFLLKLF